MDIKEVISQEVAEQDVSRWLDLKRVKAAKRETYKQYIDILVDAVMCGDVTIADDGVITQNLAIPFVVAGKEVGQLSYKLRLSVEEVNSKLGNLKITDTNGRTLAYVAALTNQPMQVVGRMDTTDSEVAYSVAVFFM